MVSLKEYDIKFGGLKPGTYTFDYKLDERFFSQFELSPITDAHIDVQVLLDKKPRFFTLVFDLKGTVPLPCDRCADEFNAEISEKSTLLVKIESRVQDEDDTEDDVIYVHEGESNINIAPYLYEFAVLALPMHPVHPDVDGTPGCNPDTLRKLQELSGDGHHSPEDEDIELLEI